MADNTTIEWTDATWNPIGGCSIKSPGCKPCYAMKLAGTRLKNHSLYAETTSLEKGRPVFNGTLTVAPDDHPTWKWPLTWRGAKTPVLGPGMPSTIFVGDMSDLFHERRPRSHIDRVVSTILQSRHIGQLLTKRADVLADYFTAVVPTPAPRLWLGFSAERQPEFDERWSHFRQLAAAGWTIFVSYEPAIGPLVLPDDFLALGRRAQVISGGMSGKDAVPSNPDWFRSVRDQCSAAGVAYFHKQNGEWAWAPDELNYADTIVWGATTFGERTRFEYHSDGRIAFRVGKNRAGRLLDGIEHNGFPA